MSVVLHISGIIRDIIVIYGTLVWNDDISWHFFHFFKILIFCVFRRVKWQKMVQNEKKFCLLCSISQQPYIVWFSFMVHVCKMIISSGVFLFFKTLIFQVARRVKGQKWPKVTKNSACYALYLRNHTLYDLHLRYTCVIG